MSTLADLPVSVQILNNPDGSGPFTGSWDLNGRKATMTFRVPWEDRETLFQAISGLPEISGGSGGTITRIVPLLYPYIGAAKMYATAINYEGKGADKNITSLRPYPWVVATVTFETLPFNLDSADQNYISVRVRGSTSFVTIPNTNFTFVGDGSKSTQDVGRMVGELAIEVTKYFVPNLDREFAILLPLAGCVNSVPLVIGKTSFDTGTVLFPTLDTESQQTILGQSQQQLSFPLMFRQIPWNSAVRSDGVVDVLSPQPYPTADLNVIFS